MAIEWLNLGLILGVAWGSPLVLGGYTQPGFIYQPSILHTLKLRGGEGFFGIVLAQDPCQDQERLCNLCERDELKHSLDPNTGIGLTFIGLMT